MSIVLVEDTKPYYYILALYQCGTLSIWAKHEDLWTLTKQCHLIGKPKQYTVRFTGLSLTSPHKRNPGTILNSDGGNSKIYTVATHCIFSSKLEGSEPGSMAPADGGVKDHDNRSAHFDWAAEAMAPTPDNTGSQLGGSSHEYCRDLALWNLEISSTLNSVKINKLKDWNLASILNNNTASCDSKFFGMYHEYMLFIIS